MNYSCGHYARLDKLSGKISLNNDVQLLILEQAVSSVPCYMCLKVLYENDPIHDEPGFRQWHKGSAISSRAYAHLLRHIAIISGIECNKDSIYPRYWIEEIWGIKNEFKGYSIYGDNFKGNV